MRTPSVPHAPDRQAHSPLTLGFFKDWQGLFELFSREPLSVDAVLTALDGQHDRLGLLDLSKKQLEQLGRDLLAILRTTDAKRWAVQSRAFGTGPIDAFSVAGILVGSDGPLPRSRLELEARRGMTEASPESWLAFASAVDALVVDRQGRIDMRRITRIQNEFGPLIQNGVHAPEYAAMLNRLLDLGPLEQRALRDAILSAHPERRDLAILARAADANPRGLARLVAAISRRFFGELEAAVFRSSTRDLGSIDSVIDDYLARTPGATLVGRSGELLDFERHAQAVARSSEREGIALRTDLLERRLRFRLHPGVITPAEVDALGRSLRSSLILRPPGPTGAPSSQATTEVDRRAQVLLRDLQHQLGAIEWRPSERAKARASADWIAGGWADLLEDLRRDPDVPVRPERLADLYSRILALPSGMLDQLREAMLHALACDDPVKRRRLGAGMLAPTAAPNGMVSLFLKAVHPYLRPTELQVMRLLSGEAGGLPDAVPTDLPSVERALQDLAAVAHGLAERRAALIQPEFDERELDRISHLEAETANLRSRLGRWREIIEAIAETQLAALEAEDRGDDEAVRRCTSVGEGLSDQLVALQADGEALANLAVEHAVIVEKVETRLRRTDGERSWTLDEIDRAAQKIESDRIALSRLHDGLFEAVSRPTMHRLSLALSGSVMAGIPFVGQVGFERGVQWDRRDPSTAERTRHNYGGVFGSTLWFGGTAARVDRNPIALGWNATAFPGVSMSRNHPIYGNLLVFLVPMIGSVQFSTSGGVLLSATLGTGLGPIGVAPTVMLTHPALQAVLYGPLRLLDQTLSATLTLGRWFTATRSRI